MVIVRAVVIAGQPNMNGRPPGRLARGLCWQSKLPIVRTFLIIFWKHAPRNGDAPIAVLALAAVRHEKQGCLEDFILIDNFFEQLDLPNPFESVQSELAQ